ncbi:MAG: hypothetical protein HYZ15_11000 [Sphingobacteriales bacterium]|nr:hypothetical protein [Sphingobacteriales bacterium]
MPQTTQPAKNSLHLLSAALLLVSFFLPWVKWEDSPLSGMALPDGSFFATSADKFGLENPYPQFSFSFYLFWLIPVLVILAAWGYTRGKKTALIAAAAGALNLSLVTVYIVFSNTLLDLGVGKSLTGLLQPSLYLSAAAAVLFIWSSRPGHGISKVAWILIGPALAFSSYRFIKNQLETSTFSNTASSKAEYTVNAVDLIREFAGNDSAANKKYTDKILLVKGRVAELEPADSSLNVKFIDSLSGSYAIFDFQAEDVAEAKKLAVGDSVSIKASCSGGIFSRLRKATVITFKRSALLP